MVIMTPAVENVNNYIVHESHLFNVINELIYFWSYLLIQLMGKDWLQFLNLYVMVWQVVKLMEINIQRHLSLQQSEMQEYYGFGFNIKGWGKRSISK